VGKQVKQCLKKGSTGWRTGASVLQRSLIRGVSTGTPPRATRSHFTCSPTWAYFGEERLACRMASQATTPNPVKKIKAP